MCGGKKIRSSTSTIHRLHPLTTWSFAPATGVVMRWWEVKHTAKRRKWKKNTYTWPTRLNWNILQHWCQAYHHTVLPPSEFYGTITDPLHVYSESCRPNRFYSAMLCIERTMLSQDVRPSVSHTPVFTAKHIVKLFSPPGNHAILVFFPSSRQYSDGDPLTGALNAKRCEKNRDIQPISRFISEMMLNKTMVTMEGEWETVPKLSNGAISNNTEQPQTQISMSHRYLTLNVAETVAIRDTDSVATKY